MLFKFLKRKIVLDCFTDQEYLLRTAPIEHANKLFPEWWKILPNTRQLSGVLGDVSTMKKCVGFKSYYTQAVALPLWSDLIVQVNRDRTYQWQYSDMSSEIEVHDTTVQSTGFLPDYGHIKLVSPWYCGTKDSIDWVWTHPAYNFKDSNDIVSLPAVVNYQIPNGTSINLMVNLREPKQILIPQGQPMVLMLPMSDRKVEIKRHLVSPQEMRRMQNLHTVISFTDKYQKMKSRVEQFKNCPFHKHV